MMHLAPWPKTVTKLKTNNREQAKNKTNELDQSEPRALVKVHQESKANDVFPVICDKAPQQ